jgi:cytochrome c-type biogenesis protein CcmE
MTLRISPRIRFSLVLIAILVNGLLLPFPGLTAGVMLEVADLLSHPDQYDKQMVIVVGQVTNVQTAANRQGQFAYGFLLKDHNGSVKVVGLGKTEVHEGDQVIVEGVFNRLRQVGRTIIYNEIKANAIIPVNRLNPDFVG